MGMRVLVTGGLGFIGSSVVDLFVEQGADVLVVDDLSANVVDPGDSPAMMVWRNPVAEGLPGDGVPMDLVVHCASPVGAVGVLPLKGEIVRRMVETTSAVVDYCRRSGARLVNVSSSEVYGFSGAYSEGDALRVPSVLSPRIEYAIGKLAGEAIVRQSAIKSVSIRPFNVAGSRQVPDGGFVLPVFARAALRGEALPVFGGSQRRAFTAVEDVARFIVDYTADCPFDVVNVGNPANTTSILDLAKLVNGRSGRAESEVRFTSGRAEYGPEYAEAEGHVKIPVITRARSVGWEPRVSLTDLVDSVLADVRFGVAA